MKKIICCIVCVLMVCLSAIYVYADNQAVATISAETVSAKAGDTVSVALKISGNPGTAYIRATLSYDERLVLKSAENGKIFSDLDKGLNLVWSSDKDTAENGTIAWLTFEIPKDMPEGSYPIEIKIRECYNDRYENKSLLSSNGCINVGSVTLKGDVNGDGKLDVTDCVRILMFAYGKRDLTLEQQKIADFDGNGGIGRTDAEELAKYIADRN